MDGGAVEEGGEFHNKSASNSPLTVFSFPAGKIISPLLPESQWFGLRFLLGSAEKRLAEDGGMVCW